MSNADYHAQSAISKSGLDLIARCPAMFKHRRENPILPTPAMRMGTLVHTAILEPHDLANLVVAPKIDRRSAAGKAEWEAFKVFAEGKEIVDADELDELQAITKAVHAHPAAGQALSMLSSVEDSIFWTDTDTGIDCRCRPDGILTNGLIIDVKTTKDARPDEFAKSIANYRYHVQSAFYSDGYNAMFGAPPKGFMFIAVETVAPYLVACYVASPEMIIRGRSDYKRDLTTYARCLETDEWPGLPEKPVKIDLPKWA
jgi:exodeoxyribonuclease VIII